MNWPALVERLARALGVWWDGDRLISPIVDSKGFALEGPFDGRYDVHRWIDGKADRRTISTGDALWLLLEVARGQRLDVGPCRACAERGGGWDVCSAQHQGGRPKHCRPSVWGSDGVEVLRHGPPRRGCIYDSLWVRACPECSEPGPAVECPDCDAGFANDGIPCFECDGQQRVPGPPQPTGRDVREPWAWVLDALPWECWCNQGRDEDDRWCPDCRGYCLGDPAVQAAAAWLARSTTPDGVAVLGDWRRDFPGKGPDECPLPPDSDRGRVIAAGLRGECQGCGGSGSDIAQHGNPHEQGDCPGCLGLGEILGAPSIAIDELAVAECEARECQGCGGRGTWLSDFRAQQGIDGEVVYVAQRSGECAGCGSTGRRSAA